MPYFGRVDRVLGYTQQSHVTLRFRDEPEGKLVAFPDATVLNVDGAWPLLTQEPPQLDIQVLVLKGLYRGMVGCVVVCETRHSFFVIILEVASREVTLSKDGVSQVLGMQDGSWTEEDMALFTPKVRVLNTWSHSTRAEYGHVVYETSYKYRVRFPDHTHYLMKHDMRLLDRPSLPQALHFGRVPAEAPVEGAEVPVKDMSVVPSDVTLSGTKSGSEGVSRDPSVASGQGSVPRSVHECGEQAWGGYGDTVKCSAPD
jgi:hypothetical protein